MWKTWFRILMHINFFLKHSDFGHWQDSNYCLLSRKGLLNAWFIRTGRVERGMEDLIMPLLCWGQLTSRWRTLGLWLDNHSSDPDWWCSSFSPIFRGSVQPLFPLGHLHPQRGKHCCGLGSFLCYYSCRLYPLRPHLICTPVDIFRLGCWK